MKTFNINDIVNIEVRNSNNITKMYKFQVIKEKTYKNSYINIPIEVPVKSVYHETASNCIRVKSLEHTNIKLIDVKEEDVK